MSSLPHGITGALHIDEPFPRWTLLAAALLLWLLYRLYSRLRERLAESPAPSAPPAPAEPDPAGFGARVDAIRRRTLASGTYREGCHELAAELRAYCARYLEPGASLLHLTAAEIARRVGDTAVARFFGLLARLQFHRRPPSRSDFDGACDLAIAVAVGVVHERRAVVPEKAS